MMHASHARMLAVRDRCAEHDNPTLRAPAHCVCAPLRIIYAAKVTWEVDGAVHTCVFCGGHCGRSASAPFSLLSYGGYDVLRVTLSRPRREPDTATRARPWVQGCNTGVARKTKPARLRPTKARLYVSQTLLLLLAICQFGLAMPCPRPLPGSSSKLCARRACVRYSNTLFQRMSLQLECMQNATRTPMSAEAPELRAQAHRHVPGASKPVEGARRRSNNTRTDIAWQRRVSMS